VVQRPRRAAPGLGLLFFLLCGSLGRCSLNLPSYFRTMGGITALSRRPGSLVGMGEHCPPAARVPERGARLALGVGAVLAWMPVASLATNLRARDQSATASPDLPDDVLEPLPEWHPH
jgi:hypothetical protein